MILTKKTLLTPLLRALSFTITHYDALGVDPDATQQQIKSKFYELAKKYHPDITKDSFSAQKFISIQQAYQILSDQKKRKEYDTTLHSNPYQATNTQYQYSYAHNDYYSHSASQSASFFHAKPSWFSLFKESAFSIILYCGFAYLFYQTIAHLDRKITQAATERQNAFIMATRPEQVEKRIALYADEIKQKNIYERVIDINTKGAPKSSKVMRRQKESLQSQPGIQKQGERGPTVVAFDEEYM